MEEILRGCGIALAAPALDLLWAYHRLLREHNPELNLTRVRNFRRMVLKLYADALLPADRLELPSPLLDLGTGAGMPGIPLKIYRPRLEVLLAESRGRRVAFLETAIARLGLEGVRVVPGRLTAAFETPVAAVITRAVEPIAATLGRVAGCLVRGGLAVFMKGPRCEAEVDTARRRCAAEYALEADHAYTIPGTPYARRLVVFRRLTAPLPERRARALSRNPAPPIVSPQNPTFKDLKRLLTARGIRKSGRALVAGEKAVRDVLARHRAVCRAWVATPEEVPPAAAAELDWIRLDPALFAELDRFGTHRPLLLIEVPPIAPWSPAEGFPPGATVLLPFQDPENVGAAVRSAAAFGAAQVLLLRESAHPFHPKALRASGGAVLEIPLRAGPSLAELPDDLPLIALSAEGEPLERASFPEAFGLLAGLEGPGLPAAWRRRAVRIPMRPGVDSLNAAAAVAVALYAWRRGRE